MLRAKLPWLFMALAVASPPLLFWFVEWSIRDDYEGTGAYYGFVVFWPIASAICIAAFVTLAAVAWKPSSQESRDTRQVMLVLFGGTSLIAGFFIFVFAVTNAANLAQFASAGVPGLVLLGVGLRAFWEWLPERQAGNEPSEPG